MDNPIFKIGKEVPDNDIGVMYYETPTITPRSTLNVINNISILNEIYPTSLGDIKELHTNEDGVLVGGDGLPYIAQNDFVITDEIINNTPLFYTYKLKYKHYSTTGQINDEINLFLDNKEYDKNDYIIEEEKIEENLYEITIKTEFKPSTNKEYKVKYNPWGVNISNYKESLNLTPIYTRNYFNNNTEELEDNEYYLKEKDNLGWIQTRYVASLEEKAYHDNIQIKYKNVEMDYNTQLNGYKAQEGKGVYLYFLIDSSESMNSSEGFLTTGYKSHELATNLINKIIPELNNLEPNNFEVNLHFAFFDNNKIKRFPAQSSWYKRNEIENIDNIYPDCKGIDVNFLTPLYDSIENLQKTQTVREGYKTIFVFISDGRGANDDIDTHEIKNHLYDANVDFIWSYLVGPEQNFTSWGGYSQEHIDFMEAFGEGENEEFAIIDREDENGLLEEEGKDAFFNSETLPQKININLKEGTITIDGSFGRKPQWVKYIKLEGSLPGDLIHPENLILKNIVNPIDSLNTKYYFNNQEIEKEIELTGEYINSEEL